LLSDDDSLILYDLAQNQEILNCLWIDAPIICHSYWNEQIVLGTAEGLYFYESREHLNSMNSGLAANYILSLQVMANQLVVETSAGYTTLNVNQ
jgi:hypothetical protein